MKNLKNKFYNFTFSDGRKDSCDLYLYGAITSYKWDDTDVDFKDFKDAIDSISDNGVLNIYQNSPGGECFVASSIIALLDRAKDRGITINSYIDSLSASASGWISCAADNLYIYNQSILMLHRPLTMTMGNREDLLKEIELLDKMQNDVMMPIYMRKAKDGVTEEQIQELVNAETWLTAKEIQEYFNCTLIESSNKMVACVDNDLFKNYRNVPQELLNQSEEVEEVEENQEIIQDKVGNESEEVVETVDNTEAEVEQQEETNVEEEVGTVVDEVVEEQPEIEDAKKKRKCETEEELVDKLNAANQTIIELNDKIDELQKIADLYNAEQDAKNKAETEKLLNDKKVYYKNKFEKLGAKDKYESKEVQDLVNNCVQDKECLLKLNQMVVDMISMEDKVVRRDVVEPVSKVENLIPETDGAAKYGFR